MSAAQHAMGTAEARFRWGTGDGLLEARLLGIKVSICRRLGRFSVGLQLMDRILVLSRREGNAQMVGQALVKKARLLGDLGDSRSALWLLQQASQQIDGEADPRLQLFLRHNLICCLIDLGEVGQARRLLRASRSTYRRFQEDYVQMNLRWVEGLVAAGLGHWEEAREALEESRQGMESLGQSHTAAQVAVDLAEVLEDLESREEALRLVQEALPRLRERSLLRETAAAEALLERLENYPATGSGIGC
jgi:tetratricopeptide (TPR) repeat protein